MPRRKKATAHVMICEGCGRQITALYLSNNKEKRPENFKKYCPTERKRMGGKFKVAKSAKK